MHSTNHYTRATTTTHVPSPEFFIVGAPKSGTTAMCEYLKQHPQTFIPKIKEPYYFCPDVAPDQAGSTLDQYLALFKEGDGRVCGEGSVWYLYSQQAASDIHKFNPDARIIIMVRNPVDYMYSLHNQLLYVQYEDIRDFAEALAAESDRKAGQRIPRTCRRPLNLLYSETARFASQIEKYFAVFGRANVHVIIYDDFKQDTAVTFRETLLFLGVNPDVQMDFKVVNPSKYLRSGRLQVLFEHLPALRKLIPIKGRIGLYKKLLRANTQFQQRPPMDPGLRQRLQAQFVPEVEQLSELLERDLTHWCREA